MCALQTLGSKQVLRSSCKSTFNDLRDLGLVAIKFKGCEEAQGAQVEGHDWRDALLQGNHTKGGVISCKKGEKSGQSLTPPERQAAEDLEERRGIEQSPIPAEADDEVHAVGDVIKICGREKRPDQILSQTHRRNCKEQSKTVVPSLKVQNFFVMAPKLSSADMAGSSRTFFST